MVLLAKTKEDTSLVPPIVKGDAATRILADFKRQATSLEVAVVQRALKNQLQRRNRASKVGNGFVIE